MAYAMGRTPDKHQQRPEEGAEVGPETDLLIDIEEQMSPAIASDSPGDLNLGAAKAPPLGPVDVRRLTGDWEKGLKTGARPKMVSPPRKASARTKPTAPLEKVKGRLPTEALEKAPITKDRVADAKANLIRAKTSLGEAKNLKGEIKVEVNRVLDRLYLLVKEAEAERKESKGKKAGKEEDVRNPEPSEVKKIDKEEILNKIEGNRKLLLENQRKMEEMERLRINAEEQQRRVSNMSDIAERDGHILAKVEENNRLLKENERKIQEMKQMIEGQTESLEKVTYASIVTKGNKTDTGNRANERKTLHSIVVTSQNEQETGEEVLEKIRKAVDAKEGWIKVERVRKAKDQKIIMGCSTKEDRDKIKQRIEKAGQSLVVEDMKNKDPLLVLKDVFIMNSDEEIIRALRNQNRGVFHDLKDEENRIAVKYKKKTRNPHTAHIVVTVSPIIWGRATEQGRLRIDLQNVYVEDQSPLVQCSKCLGYGHGRRFCKAPDEACSYCGKPHLSVDCPEKADGDPPQCINCRKAGIFQSNHSAFSRECPVRKKWDKIARASLQYC